jgi:hypothetical protein
MFLLGQAQQGGRFARAKDWKKNQVSEDKCWESGGKRPLSADVTQIQLWPSLSGVVSGGISFTAVQNTLSAVVVQKVRFDFTMSDKYSGISLFFEETN